MNFGLIIDSMPKHNSLHKQELLFGLFDTGFIDIGNLKCDAPVVNLPAGLMGIDKGQKDQSPLLFILKYN